MATAPLTGRPVTTKYSYQLGGAYTNTALYTAPPNTVTIIFMTSVVPAGSLSYSILTTTPTSTALACTTSDGVTWTSANASRVAGNGSTSTLLGGFYMFPGEVLVVNGDGGGNATSGVVFVTFELIGQS
jgi:hypothetical protein